MREKHKNSGLFSRSEEREYGAEAIPPPPPRRPSPAFPHGPDEDSLPHGPTVEQRESPMGLDVPLHPAFIARGREALKELEAASPGAGADERILHRLVADQLAITSALVEAQAQLAGRVRLLIDEPKHLFALIHVLKDVVHTTNAISRRIEGALGAAANLRAQRRFFANHGGKRTIDGS